MATSRPRFARTSPSTVLPVVIGSVLASVTVLAGCDSDDDPGGDDVPPAGTTTVVPPDPNGVGGGVPIDNLDPDVADTVYQTDIDGGP